MNNEKAIINESLKNFDAICNNARTKIMEMYLKHYQSNSNSPYTGLALKKLEASINSFYKNLGIEVKGAFRETLPEVLKSVYDRASVDLKKAGLRRAIVGDVDPKRINYFLDSTFKQVAMYTDKMAFSNIRDLRLLSSKILRESVVSGLSRREVSKMMLSEAMKIKGFEFISNSDKNWPLKSYFNMLARTELMNSARASYDDKMAEEGFDVMKLTTSGKSCDKCAKFEGRLFSLTGATPTLPSKADLESAGVFHPNCTHSYSLVPRYIIERDYNSDGSKKENHNAVVPYQFKQGELNQHQSFKNGNSVTRHKNGSISIDNTDNFPNDKKYAKMKSCYEAAKQSPAKFLAKAIEKGILLGREFCATYSNDKFFSLSMGAKGTGSATYKLPLNNGRIFHNHTTQSSLSAKDVFEFIINDAKEISVITPNNTIYSLKYTGKGSKLTLSELQKRYAIANEKYGEDFDKIWKEVFYEESYEYR